MSVWLQDQLRCLRERSRRGEPATTEAVHELDLRDQDVENEHWAWRTAMSYDSPFVSTCSLLVITIISIFPRISLVRSRPRAPRRGARLLLHPSETLD